MLKGNSARELQKYFINTASFHGWGEGSAKLDPQRVKLIPKFLVGRKILDVGCGLGLYVDFISSLGYESWGVDFVDEFIRNAKKNKKGHFVKANAEKLPFENNSFDTVLLFDILEHGEDSLILKEAVRASNKRVIFIVPRQVDSELEKSGVIFRHYIDKTHQREYVRERITQLLKSANLKIKYIDEIHNLFNDTIFLSLFEGPLFLKKIIRKITFLLLKPKEYPTEFFVVADKIP